VTNKYLDQLDRAIADHEERILVATARLARAVEEGQLTEEEAEQRPTLPRMYARVEFLRRERDKLARKLAER
jgi:hypothetical protein